MGGTGPGGARPRIPPARCNSWQSRLRLTGGAWPPPKRLDRGVAGADTGFAPAGVSFFRSNLPRVALRSAGRAMRRGAVLAAFALAYAGYLLLGALIISAVERPYESRLRAELWDLKSDFLRSSPCLSEARLERFLGAVLSADRHSAALLHNGSAATSSWDFASAFFFASTLITTVGESGPAALLRGKAAPLSCTFRGSFRAQWAGKGREGSPQPGEVAGSGRARFGGLGRDPPSTPHSRAQPLFHAWTWRRVSTLRDALLVENSWSR